MSAGVVLALVWIGVYWATPPTPSAASDPGIVFADDRSSRSSEQASQRLTLAPEAVAISMRESAPTSPAVEPAPMEQARASTPLPPAQPAVIRPEFREHTVRSGETMETIARSQLGDAALWTAVASANPRVDPLKLRVGQKIRIPLDPRNIQGVPNPEVVAARPPSPVSDEPTRIEYVVRRGDTLGAIARTYYNSSARWQLILDAKRDKISRPEEIRPGMTLVIPPAPPSD